MVVVYVPELDVKHVVKAVDVIQPSMYDAMVNTYRTKQVFICFEFRAVFRYLHQVIYPRFVSAAHHRSRKRERTGGPFKSKADTEKKMTSFPLEMHPKT